jgi:tetratricopeptide (TPR) repeat protein
MAVTDRRILFVSGEGSETVDADAGSLAYENLAAVGTDDSETGTVLSLSMENGLRWEFPLPDTDRQAVESVVRHLRWVGRIRTRVVACRNDIELAAGEIRSHASEMNWMEAETTYDAARSRLDELITAVQCTEPVDDRVLAPELTGLERTLERAYAWLFIERANSQLELGRQLVESGDYEQARSVLRTAGGQCVRASERADAVRRADEFRFGEHRDLRDALDRIERELETVAAEPIRQAHEAKITATNADDPTMALEHWESAYQRYRDVLALDVGTDGRDFTGDHDKVREELHDAATRLIERHRRLAREKWNEGRNAKTDGEPEATLRAYSVACDHIERATELAREFDPDVARELGVRRQEMGEEIDRLRERSGVTTQAGDADSEPDGTESTSADADPRTGAESLAEMDTHHDISFDTALDGQAADGGRHHQPMADETDDSFIGPRRADSDGDESATEEQPLSPDDASGE